MTTTRTDIHRPSAAEFDPQEYTCVGVFDLNPDEGSFNDTPLRIEAVNHLLDQGYHFAAHQNGGQCGHCGARIRYAALMAREDVHEMIYVGETCLGNRFEDMTKAQFDALRKAAQLDREKHAKLAAFNQLMADHPELTPATYAYNLVFDIEAGEFAHEKFNTGWACSVIEDILSKARTYGQISDKQVAFVAKLIGEIEDKITNYVPAVPAGDAPRGRATVEGIIVSIKEVEGYMGGSAYKMTVKLDNGARVYGTVPSAISTGWDLKFHMDHLRDTTGAEGWISALLKARVQFTATFEASKNDPQADFAFFKRPVQSKIAEFRRYE